MTVTFDSKVGRVTMLGDVAISLLKMMGHSGTVPSALLAEDIPEALSHLRQSLAAADALLGNDSHEREDTERPAVISLRTRAYPLMQLLENAAKHSAAILWDQDGSAPLQF
jgi:hypothetical protein